MGIAKLAHCSIRSTDLRASRRFYTEVLQLREGSRPPFSFPGVWFYLGDDESEQGVVHIIGVEADAAPASGAETGHFDHMAFFASDWPSMRARLQRYGVDYVEQTVPVLGLHQVFIVEPSGVTIELNYPAAF